MIAADCGNAGFAIEPGVFGSSMVSALADALDTAPGRSRAGARHLLAHPAVAELARHPYMLTLARAWIGPTASPYRATLFDKSSGSNWLVAWHQDTALPLRFRREVPGWGLWSVKAGVTYAHAPARVLEGLVAH